jgi:hypothetical protein
MASSSIESNALDTWQNAAINCENIGDHSNEWW